MGELFATVGAILWSELNPLCWEQASTRLDSPHARHALRPGGRLTPDCLKMATLSPNLRVKTRNFFGFEGKLDWISLTKNSQCIVCEAPI